jgi:hypothetical protein
MKYYYTLSFSYTFKYTYDVVYFAYSQPYTYSDLQEDMSRWEKDGKPFFTRNLLCNTLAGNKCEYITITSRDMPPILTQAQKEKLVSDQISIGMSNTTNINTGQPGHT